jgi:formylglycine-generating enzyme required for sulfatase activity
MIRGITWSLIVLWTLTAASAAAGPWVELPDAIAQLQTNPQNRAAARVLDSTAAAIRNEAVSGHLAAVSVLMEVYASLVMRLPDGEERLQRVGREVSEALVAFGSARRAGDLATAATAWTLAAGYDPSGPATGLLRGVLLATSGAEHGDVWRAPLDGAELIFLEPARVRVGCSDNDRRCRENEVFFRWVELPGVWVERHEVTNARYRACVAAGACTPPRERGRFDQLNRGDRPVVGVTWRQAREFASWAGRSLPSEAVWERAARAGDSRWRFPWGNSRSLQLANVWDETTGAERGLLDVGQFPATGPGFFDLAGNVWEWCEDRYQPGLKQLPKDGAPVREGFGRVVRGGSWRRTIDLARVSTRSWYDEDYAADDLGFRCVQRDADAIGDPEVLAAASRSFALRVTPGKELDEASLSAEDRRYLDRRAITWLLLENRVGDAARYAVSLLAREARDPVVAELFDRVELEMVTAARDGDIEHFQSLRISFERAASFEPQYARRQRAARPRLVEALRACGERAARSGDRSVAAACLETGLALSSSDEAWQRLRALIDPAPGQTRVTAKDGRTMVWVPAGAYRIGASDGDRMALPEEYPPITVTIQGFWIDRDEVSNAEYRRCVEAGACTSPIQTAAYDDPARADHPVLWVSWFQAREFARWAGKRLPTESEWEVASRAGGDSRFPWGERWDQNLANGFSVGERDLWEAEAPVGSFPPNAWGIRDLIGNAAEWVEDVYHTSLAHMPRDGRAWLQETGAYAERERVVRGGSWADSASKLRVSRRDSRRPTDSHRTTGFRCASD